MVSRSLEQCVFSGATRNCRDFGTELWSKENNWRHCRDSETESVVYRGQVEKKDKEGGGGRKEDLEERAEERMRSKI